MANAVQKCDQIERLRTAALALADLAERNTDDCQEWDSAISAVRLAAGAFADIEASLDNHNGSGLMREYLAKKWCQFIGSLTLGQTHGGIIERDDEGRINWRCATCGRWSDYPVPLDVERKVVDREIAFDAKHSG